MTPTSSDNGDGDVDQDDDDSVTSATIYGTDFQITGDFVIEMTVKMEMEEGSGWGLGTDV